MKTRGYLFLLGFAVFIIIIGIACSGGATPTAQPSQPQQPAPTTQSIVTQSIATQSNSNTTNTGNSSALVTFTDKNKFYQIDLPGDWVHTSGSGSDNYWDRFTAPDGNAVIENIAIDDGTPWPGSLNGQQARHLLNFNYSYTKKEGDIRIPAGGDKIQPDGSESLEWTSKGGGYSGVSYFEVRNQTTFLMLTLWWSNDYKDTYLDTINQVVASYVIP